MDVQVNLWGVAAAVVAAMAIGAVWYSKTAFGARWVKLVKLNEKKARQDMPKAMFAMVMMTGVTAYVLAHVTFLSYTFFGYSYLSSALTTAFWMWLGFIAPATIMLGAFEQRDIKLTGINLGYSLVSFLIMGLAIGMAGI